MKFMGNSWKGVTASVLAKIRAWLNRNFQTRRSRLVLSAVLLGALGTSNYFLRQIEVPPQYRIIFYNGTTSTPRGIYLRIPNFTDLPDGAYVVFSPNEATTKFGKDHGWFKEDTFFLKQVGAVAGESYRIDPVTLQFFANEKYIGQVSRNTSQGTALPFQRGDFIVPDGEFLPVGLHPRSFDGRYTGTVPEKNILARVVPVFTELHW